MTNLTPKIDSFNVSLIQHSNGIKYRVNMPAEMTVEQLTNPEAWTHVKRSFPLSVGNILECVKEDLSAFIELFVVGSSDDLVYLRVLRNVELEDPKEDEKNSLHEIKYLGPIKKHTIIRVSDGKEKQSGISSRVLAEEWIKNNT